MRPRRYVYRVLDSDGRGVVADLLHVVAASPAAAEAAAAAHARSAELAHGVAVEYALRYSEPAAA